MPIARFSKSFILVAFVLLAGCHLPGLQGPVSRALQTSRQYSRQGITAMEQDDWPRAETFLAKAVRSCSANDEARRYYAEVLWHRGARKKAISQLEEVAKLGCDEASIRVRVAQMRLEMGQLQEASKQVEDALDLNSKSTDGWAVRARIARANGNTRQALADFHRALTFAPNNRTILLETAELYSELKEPTRALAVLHRLTDMYSPGEEPQQVLFLRGLAYAALNRYDNAAADLAIASTRGKPSPEIYCRLAEVEQALGKTEKAALTARQALALDPQHVASHQLLGHLEVARHPSENPSR